MTRKRKRPKAQSTLLHVVVATWCIAFASPSSVSAQGLLKIEAIKVEQAKDAPAPEPTPAKAVVPVAPKRAAKPPVAVRADVLERPILIPALYPNPLAFNVNWLGVKPREALAAARVLARKRQVAQRRIAPAAVMIRGPQLDEAGKKALNQQVRKVLEPMVKAELSFAVRAADMQPPERQKLIAGSKDWFDKFIVDFTKNQDPNQQQMLLQGVQGVWFGGRQQRPKDPRDAIREGMVGLVEKTVPKEKVDVYKEECRKREEFAKQASVENLVERLDAKVKLSPDQWQKIATALNENWDKNRDPQLEAFATNSSMWTGAPDQWVLPQLTPAQQVVLRRINSRVGQVWFGGGMLNQMFGGEGGIIDDIEVDFDVPGDVDANQAAPAAQPAYAPVAVPADNPFE